MKRSFVPWMLTGSAAVLATIGALYTAPVQADLDVSEQPIIKFLSNGVNAATVTIQPESRAVEVRLLAETNLAPPSVELVFYDEKANPVTLSLQATQKEGAAQAYYQGSFMPNLMPHLGGTTGSFIGIELRIPWAIGAPSVLRPIESLNPIGPTWSFR